MTPEPTPHQREWIDGLRSIADTFERHPDLIRGHAIVHSWQHPDPVGMVRAFPGKWELRDPDKPYPRLSLSVGGHEIVLYNAQNATVDVPVIVQRPSLAPEIAVAIAEVAQ